MRELVAVFIIWLCMQVMTIERAREGGLVFAFFLVVWMVAVLFLALSIAERWRGDDGFRINPGVPPLPELYSENDKDNDDNPPPPPRQ